MELKSFTPVHGAKSYWADFVKEVTSGAALLDAIAPGWIDAIDIPKLDLSQGDQCILGQVWINGLLTPAVQQVVKDLGLDADDYVWDNQYDSLCAVIYQLQNTRHESVKAVLNKYGEFDPHCYGFDISGEYDNDDYVREQCKCRVRPNPSRSHQDHDSRCRLSRLYNPRWQWEQLGFAWMAEIEARREALSKEATT